MRRRIEADQPPYPRNVTVIAVTVTACDNARERRHLQRSMNSRQSVAVVAPPFDAECKSVLLNRFTTFRRCQWRGESIGPTGPRTRDTLFGNLACACRLSFSRTWNGS